MVKSLSLGLVLLAACGATSAQTFTVIHNFGSNSGDPGQIWPVATISQGRGGDIFTTSSGNSGIGYGLAAAFRIGPLGSVHVLHAWDSWASRPVSGLILGTDSNYYGATEFGGPDKAGTLFRVSGRDANKTLHVFTAYEGQHPTKVIQGTDGDFYIITGGASVSWQTPPADFYGSIFRMTRDGNITLLHAFNGSDGTQPMGLVQGTDSFFYGVTGRGGLNDAGTIFRISSTGDFKVIYNFDDTHGGWPGAGLIQANDGNFYGTTGAGGATENGVLFRITPNGTYTDLHDFTRGADGGAPQGKMVQGSDGNLYGTAQGGGDTDYGIIFRASLNGVVTGLFSFSEQLGWGLGDLLQHTNGMLYGAATFGGKHQQGFFYSFDVGLAPFVTYLPTSGVAGAEVQILGQGFTDTTKVSFNGVPAASVTVIYPTFLKATIPAGATTGFITVTTTNGTLKSNQALIVH